MLENIEIDPDVVKYEAQLSRLKYLDKSLQILCGRYSSPERVIEVAELVRKYVEDGVVPEDINLENEPQF